MKATKSRFMKKPMGTVFGVGHLGGKKFGQQCAEYLSKEKEVRRHRTGGRPHIGDRPTG